MDQEKIGKFIAKCRKDKKMTQRELADKLNITDRAISNWETGRRMPDISFFKPLCEILDISVNELINGEKITKNKMVATSDEIIIHTLSINKKIQKKSKYIIRVSLIILTGLITIMINYYHHLYPKFDIYNIAVSQSNNEEKLKKQLSDKNYNIYYYGIDSVQLCDGKEICYELKVALNKKQINMEKIKKYFESQYTIQNLKRHIMYDGGTTIYSTNRYTTIFCNTLKNKDVYIGTSDMLNRLNGSFCDKEENTTKTFIRTYYVISATDDDDEDNINVTLKNFQGDTALVKIDKSSNIIVGNTYEFTFLNYYEFTDTIQNIFEYSTLIHIQKTDKIGLEQINEPISINE